MDNKVIFQVSYGLYVLTSKTGDKNNGCIINTVVQQTSTPLVISITVNKQNYTESMLEKSGEFNVSIIDESAPFSLFQHFGFQTGAEVDKFADFADFAVAENGINYVNTGCCGYISAKVTQTLDLESHVMFLAEVTDAKKLSENAPMTYAYYHANVKPKPAAKNADTKGKVWVCKICGYVYDETKEGKAFEDLPDDWVCPLCKHGKADFELA